MSVEILDAHTLPVLRVHHPGCRTAARQPGRRVVRKPIRVPAARRIGRCIPLLAGRSSRWPGHSTSATAWRPACLVRRARRGRRRVCGGSQSPAVRLNCCGHGGPGKSSFLREMDERPGRGPDAHQRTGSIGEPSPVRSSAWLVRSRPPPAGAQHRAESHNQEFPFPRAPANRRDPSLCNLVAENRAGIVKRNVARAVCNITSKKGAALPCLAVRLDAHHSTVGRDPRNHLSSAHVRVTVPHPGDTRD